MLLVEYSINSVVRFDGCEQTYAESGSDSIGHWIRPRWPGRSSSYWSSKVSIFLQFLQIFFCKLDHFPTLNSLVVADGSSDLTWGLVTTNQTVGGLAHNLTVSVLFFLQYILIVTLIRGKVLGGSSAINGMMFTRGTIGQYDALEELGNPGWNFTSLQGYCSCLVTGILIQPFT